jgi:integrase
MNRRSGSTPTAKRFVTMLFIKSSPAIPAPPASGPSSRPHALRRACATHMLRNGAHPLQLQTLLGHATLETLSQYLRLSIAELQQTHQESNPGF